MNVLACRRFCAWLVLAIFAFTICAIPIWAADNVVVLKAERMFDGKSKTLVQHGVVIIQGDKIVDVGSNLPVPDGAQVIDLGDATLSPGFMDAHTHLTLDFSGNYNERRLHELDLNVSEQAIKATTYARATVEAGFTTVRDLGSRFVSSREFVDVALRNSINKGVVVGPRMLVATSMRGPTTTPLLIELRSATSTNSRLLTNRLPKSRTVVKPASTVARAYVVALIACSETLRSSSCSRRSL